MDRKRYVAMLLLALGVLAHNPDAKAEKPQYCDDDHCYYQKDGCKGGAAGTEVTTKKKTDGSVVDVQCIPAEQITQTETATKCGAGKREAFFEKGTEIEVDSPAPEAVKNTEVRCVDVEQPAEDAASSEDAKPVPKGPPAIILKLRLHTDAWERNYAGFKLYVGYASDFRIWSPKPEEGAPHRLNMFSTSKFVIGLANNYHAIGGYIETGAIMNNNMNNPLAGWYVSAGPRLTFGTKPVRSYLSLGPDVVIRGGTDTMYMGKNKPYASVEEDVEVGIKLRLMLAINKRFQIGPDLRMIVWRKSAINSGVMVTPQVGQPILFAGFNIYGLPL